MIQIHPKSQVELCDESSELPSPCGISFHPTLHTSLWHRNLQTDLKEIIPSKLEFPNAIDRDVSVESSSDSLSCCYKGALQTSQSHRNLQTALGDIVPSGVDLSLDTESGKDFQSDAKEFFTVSRTSSCNGYWQFQQEYNSEQEHSTFKPKRATENSRSKASIKKSLNQMNTKPWQPPLDRSSLNLKPIFSTPKESSMPALLGCSSEWNKVRHGTTSSAATEVDNGKDLRHIYIISNGKSFSAPPDDTQRHISTSRIPQFTLMESLPSAGTVAQQQQWLSRMLPAPAPSRVPSAPSIDTDSSELGVPMDMRQTIGLGDTVAQPSDVQQVAFPFPGVLFVACPAIQQLSISGGSDSNAVYQPPTSPIEAPSMPWDIGECRLLYYASEPFPRNDFTAPLSHTSWKRTWIGGRATKPSQSKLHSTQNSSSVGNHKTHRGIVGTSTRAYISPCGSCPITSGDLTQSLRYDDATVNSNSCESTAGLAGNHSEASTTAVLHKSRAAYRGLDELRGCSGEQCYEGVLDENLDFDCMDDCLEFDCTANETSHSSAVHESYLHPDNSPDSNLDLDCCESLHDGNSSSEAMEERVDTLDSLSCASSVISLDSLDFHC